MSKRLIQIKKNNDAMQLTWILNNICTNHCDYCNPSLHRGTNHHYDWVHAKSFVERLFKRYSSIHCSISGGEPTLSPFFPELVKMFHDSGHTVGITSNGARTPRFWEEISPLLSYICFSFHPSYEDPQFLEKALLSAQYTWVTVRVMMDSRHWDRSVAMYEECCKHGNLFVEPVRILPEVSERHVGDDYTPQQLEWMRTNIVKNRSITIKNPAAKVAKIGADFFYDDGSCDLSGSSNELINTGQTDFRGWSCNIGLESLFVHWDGIVKKGNCNQGGDLFHINEHEKHQLPTSAEICFQNLCSCGTDVLISKVPVFDKNDAFIVDNSSIRKPKTEAEYKLTYYDDNNRVKKSMITGKNE